MPHIFMWSLLVTLTFLINTAYANTNLEATCKTASAIKLTDKGCDDTPATLKLACEGPSDVYGALAQKNYNDIQRAADIFSWEQFIALNLPAAEGKREYARSE